MLNFIMNTVRYIFTLYFGVFVTTSIIGIKNNKKNILILNAFCVIDLLLDLMLIYFKSSASVISAYPLVTHLPLLLILIFVFHRSVLKSLLAVTSAYMCCQICNWMSIITEWLGYESWIVDLTYIAGIFSHILYRIQVHRTGNVRYFCKARCGAHTYMHHAIFLLHIRLCNNSVHAASLQRQPHSGRVCAISHVHQLSDVLCGLLSFD